MNSYLKGAAVGCLVMSPIVLFWLLGKPHEPESHSHRWLAECTECGDRWKLEGLLNDSLPSRKYLQPDCDGQLVPSRATSLEAPVRSDDSSVLDAISQCAELHGRLNVCETKVDACREDAAQLRNEVAALQKDVSKKNIANKRRQRVKEIEADVERAYGVLHRLNPMMPGPAVCRPGPPIRGKLDIVWEKTDAK